MIIKPNIFTNDKIASMQSTRLNGSSKKPYDSMNLGVFGDDSNAQINIESLQNLPHSPIFMQQVHGNQVVQYTQMPQKHGENKADACFTREKNTICAVLTADCLPVLIADTDASVVAAVHCGWRGLFADILEKTITKLDADNKKLQCWLGPCISYKPYRVDEKFRQKFVQKDKEFAHCFYMDKKKVWHADLKKIAVTQLEALGIEQIVQSPYCTFDNKNLFYSYRRDGETGRMASLIWLR
jgi:YfiH family protein